MNNSLFVVWFKKDLRWHDQVALSNAAAWAQQYGGVVLPLWVYEPAMWQQPDMAVQHLGFANECLSELGNWVQQDVQITSTDSHPGLFRMHGDM